MKSDVKSLKKHLLEIGRDKNYNELAQQYGITDKQGVISGERVRGIFRR